MTSYENKTVLEVRDLTVSFGEREVLSNLSFELHQNEILGIVGESGAGKSILASAILNIIRPPGKLVKGNILVDGRDLVELPHKHLMKVRGGMISLIFGDPGTRFDPLFTIGNQIIETIVVHRSLSKRQARDEAIKYLAAVGIPSPEERLQDYPHQFSGGMIQRAMIALALACKPKLLIADNPTQSLDVTIQAQILELFKELNVQGTTILLISHNLGLIKEMAHNVLVLYRGHAVEYGNVNHVIHRPRHPYTKALIASLPRMSGARQNRLPVMPKHERGMEEGCIFRSRCAERMPVCVNKPSLHSDRNGEDHLAACWLQSEDAGLQTVGGSC